MNWNPTPHIRRNTVSLDDLEISFHRTIRVPDTNKTSKLPPTLGCFPLYEAKHYAAKLPSDMAAKGGLFFPMYQREAMWIKFRSNKKYAIKLYLGGVNAISGEPVNETFATTLRRRTLVNQGISVQDYMVVPDQQWIDGIATSPGKVKQFVATPIGSGQSVEFQVTGQDVVGGLQFEITPTAMHHLPARQPVQKYPKYGQLTVLVEILTGESIPVYCDKNETISAVKNKIYDYSGTDPNEQRLIFAGKQLEDNCSLSDYNIMQGSTIHLVKRIRGGGPMTTEMTLGAGGSISQTVVQDQDTKWAKVQTKVFNVQILNSLAFKGVTGMPPPESPVDVSTYTQNGFPFFQLYNEPSSSVAGDFSMVKSIAQLTGQKEEHLQPRTALIGSPYGFFNQHGPYKEFRATHEIEEEIKSEGETLF